MDARELTKLRKRVRQLLREKRQQEARIQRSPIHMDLDALSEIYDCLEASAQDPDEWA